MSTLAQSAALAIGISAVLTFYTALLHLTRKRVRRFYIFRFVRDLIVGLQALQLCFVATDLQFKYPWVLYPFISLVFISGPLNYMRYYMFLYPGERIPRRLIVEMTPAWLIFLWETWFYFVNPTTNAAKMQQVFAQPTHYLVSYVVSAGIIVALVQYALLLRMQLSFLQRKETREPVIFSSVLMAGYMVATPLVGGGFLFAAKTVMLTGILLFGLTGIVYLLFENRYPHFYQLVAREDRQQKYKRSLILGLSKDKIIDRLRELMEGDRIYRDLELKLDDVAAMLLITPHQLSEFVNDCMGMNFSSYVNRYRVEEAKELLVTYPEQSALSIAFDVGFGSKQSFNTIFKQHTGMTPSEYRKTILRY